MVDQLNPSTVEQEVNLPLEYLAGAADGLIRPILRKTIVRNLYDAFFVGLDQDENEIYHGLQPCIVVDTKDIKYANFWSGVLGRDYITLESKYLIQIYDPTTIADVLHQNRFFRQMILRKREFDIFTDLIYLIKALKRTKRPEIRQYLMPKTRNFYADFNDDVAPLSVAGCTDPAYLAGLFEMSPKGSITYEVSPETKSGRIMVIRISSKYYKFIHALQRIYGGLEMERKGKSPGHTWKVSGKAAEAIYYEVLDPNFKFGGIDFNREP